MKLSVQLVTEIEMKSKKGQTTLLMEIILALILVFTITSFAANVSDKEGATNLYIARDLTDSTRTISTIPSNYDIHYETPQIIDNKCVNVEDNEISVQRCGTKDIAMTSFAYSLFPTTTTLFLDSETEQLNLGSLAIQKIGSVLSLNRETELELKEEFFQDFKDEYVYLESTNPNLNELNIAFNKIIKQNLLTTKNDAKINLIITISDEETTTITYSATNKEYLRIYAEKIQQSLQTINSKIKDSFNVKPITECSDCGEISLNVVLEKKFKESNDEGITALKSTLGSNIAYNFNLLQNLNSR